MITVYRSVRRLVLAAAVLTPLGRVHAQRTFAVRPGSRVILVGSSNVHGWSCISSTFAATVSLHESDTAGTEATQRPAIGLTVVVPVQSMNCGMTRMNGDLRRALKSDSFPTIRYVLTSYTFVERRAASDSFFIHSVGELTVAGVTRRVEIPVRGVRRANGDMAGAGGVGILMTDFGVKPPTAFFGAIRARNALVVRLEMLVSGDEVQTLSLRSPASP
jgi:polyisoprenoid-binding protein YceI